MASLILYVGITVIGYLIGTRLRTPAPADSMSAEGGTVGSVPAEGGATGSVSAEGEAAGSEIAAGRKDPYAWLGSLQTVVIAVLVFLMGSRIGASEEIIASLGTIGLKAFAYTLIIMAAAVVGFALARRLLGFDRYGRRGKESDAHPEEGIAGGPKEKRGIDPMTIMIIGFVALGIAAGHFILPEVFIGWTGDLLTVNLCILLLLIGVNIAREGTLGANFRSAGWRIFVFPFVSILTMMAGAVFAAWCLSMTVQDALCVGAGFGWYTLAPAMLAPYSVEVSALSFLHNVMRELFSVLVIPIIARRIGYIECYSVAGSSTMDVCLPIIAHSAGSTVAVYGFITGTVLAIAVPVLESLFIGL